MAWSAGLESNTCNHTHETRWQILKLMPPDSPLPYPDTKPAGAADFYFALNETFRFILARLGMEGLRRRWTDMGASYCRPVAKRWPQGGLPGVAEYWRAYFLAEPGAVVEVGEFSAAPRTPMTRPPRSLAE